MIETLDGIFETVNWKQSTSLKLYNNNEYEDYPAHWHTALEIIMPTKNIYTVETSDQTFTLREGDIIFMFPGCIHTLYAPESGERIIFQPDIRSLRFLNEIEALVTRLSPFFIITPEKYPSIHHTLHDLLVEIRDDYLESNTYSEVDIYSKLLKILVLVGRNVTNDSESPLIRDHAKQSEYYDKFIKICDYISDHCAEDLTLEQIADMSGFSKFYFSKLFKQFTNVSFYKYVNQKRIAMAEIMLIDPKNSVTDVALSCGFSSLSPFIRMFKLIKGCTPTEFRNMYT
ncbi:MAG: AraC family transcriptional regulator [bacterium]|nr:AraC family transcriptional regulator [bacterium]